MDGGGEYWNTRYKHDRSKETYAKRGYAHTQNRGKRQKTGEGMSKETDGIWEAINSLRKKYADLCGRMGTVEGKLSVLLSISTGTLLAVITTAIIIIFRGG